jgi:hypothetical protein
MTENQDDSNADSQSPNRNFRVTLSGLDIGSVAATALTSNLKLEQIFSQNLKVAQLATHSSLKIEALTADIRALGKRFEDYNISLVAATAPFRAWQASIVDSFAPYITMMDDVRKQLAWIAFWDERNGPSNWPKGRATRLRLEKLSKSHSLAMYGYPSLEMVSEIVALKTATDLNRYLSENSAAIGRDLENTLASRRYPRRLKKPLVEVARSLSSGNLMAAQSLAFAVTEDVRSVLKDKTIAEGDRDVEIDLVPNSHYGWGYVMEAVRGSLESRSKRRIKGEPRRLNRHSVAHKVDGQQYTPKNAIRASLLAFSIVEVWHTTPTDLKELLAQAASEDNPYRHDYERRKKRRDSSKSRVKQKEQEEKRQRNLKAVADKELKRAAKEAQRIAQTTMESPDKIDKAGADEQRST